MIDEEWRAVTRFEGIYEVSNKGRVRSLDRMVKGKLIEAIPTLKLISYTKCYVKKN